MTLLIALLLLYLAGITSPMAYILVFGLWLAHLFWHSTSTNKLF